jgi:hypothetical protein
MQPCWSLLNDVKEHAQSEALRKSRVLVKEKFGNSLGMLVQICDCKQCEIHAQTGKAQSAQKLQRETNIMITRYLRDFVAQHVLLILIELYATIHEVQGKLEPRPSESSIMPSSMEWLREIYTPHPNGNGSTANQGRSLGIKMVGPVGERPLHVCALSAYRFNDTKFQDGRNYVQDGIIQGMREFVEKQYSGWDDIWVPYGKDYCAAIGTYLSKNVDEKKAWHSKKYPEPPFWSKLVKWYYVHTRRDKLGCTATSPNQSELMQPANSDLKTMVTTGVYEGETILLPMMAARDIRTVNWILQFSDKASDKKGKLVKHFFCMRFDFSADIIIVIL